jgi:hypothetical protein
VVQGRASPVEVQAAHVARATVHIPWRQLLSQGVRVELCDVAVAMLPRVQAEDQKDGEAAQPQPDNSSGRSSAAVASVKAAARAAAAHVLARLGVVVTGLRIHLSACDDGDTALSGEQASVTLTASEVAFTDVSSDAQGQSHRQPFGSADDSAAAAGARKRCSVAGLQLHVGQAQRMACVLGAADQEGTSLVAGLRGSVALQLPGPQDASQPASVELDLAELTLRCTPRAVRDAVTVARLCIMGRRCAARRDDATTAVPEQSLLDSLFLPATGVEQEEDDVDPAEFFDCAEPPSPATMFSPHAFFTPRAHSLGGSGDEEADHWSVDHWRSLHDSAAVSEALEGALPMGAFSGHSAAEHRDADAVPMQSAGGRQGRPWRVTCKLQRLSACVALDADARPQRAEEACVLTCEGCCVAATLLSGVTLPQNGRIAIQSAQLVRVGAAATVRGERAAMTLALPDVVDDIGLGSNQHSPADLPILTFKHHGGSGMACAAELHGGEEQSPARVTCTLDAASLWLDDGLADLAHIFVTDCALETRASSAGGAVKPPRGYSIDVVVPQLRVVQVKGDSAIVLDLCGPRGGPRSGSLRASPPSPMLTWAVDAESRELAVAAYLSTAGLQLCTPLAHDGAHVAHRLARAANLNVRVTLQPQATERGRSYFARRAWSVTTAAGEANDLGRTCFTPTLADAAAKLRGEMLTCAAVHADVDVEVAELCSTAAMPLARLFTLLSDTNGSSSEQQASHTVRQAPAVAADVGLALSLRCGRVSLMVEDATGGVSALRLRQVVLTQAGALDGIPGASLLTATCAAVSCMAHDGTCLLQCGTDAGVHAASAPHSLTCVVASRPHATHVTGEMVVSVALHDAILPIAAGDLNLSRLWGLLRSAGAQCAPPAPLGPDGLPLPAPLIDVHVCAVCAAGVHQLPQPSPGAVSGALLVDALSLHIDGSAVALALRGAALHVSPPEGAAGNQTVDLRAVPTSASLGASGYASVVRDTRVALTCTWEPLDVGGGDASPASWATVLVIDNDCLLVDTHADTYAAVLALLGQLQQSGGAASEAPPDDEPPAVLNVDADSVRNTVHRQLGEHAVATKDPRGVSGLASYASTDSGLSSLGAALPACASPELIEDFFQRADGGLGLDTTAEVALFDDDDDGDWTLTQAPTQQHMTPAAGSPPAGGMRRAASAPSAGAPRRGVYVPPSLIADYAAPRPGIGGAASVDAPPAHYPPATWRLVLHPFNCTFTMHVGQGFALTDRAAAASSSPPSGGRKACPVRGVRVSLHRVTMRKDIFVQSGPAASAAASVTARTVLSCGSLVAEDITPASKWQRIVCADTDSAPRHAGSPDVRLLLLAVAPSPGASLETRLHLAATPLRVRLDQHIVHFTTAFFTAAATMAEAADAAPPPPAAPVLTFFQVAECAPLRVRVDYQPRRFDGSALLNGATAEALNLAPWGDVALTLPGLRLTGLTGSVALAGALADAWASHVASTQAHRFAAGLRGVRPLLALLAAPVEGYRAARASSASSHGGGEGRAKVAVRGAFSGAKAFGKHAASVVGRHGKSALRAAAATAAAVANEVKERVA